MESKINTILDAADRIEKEIATLRYCGFSLEHYQGHLHEASTTIVESVLRLDDCFQAVIKTLEKTHSSVIGSHLVETTREREARI